MVVVLVVFIVETISGFATEQNYQNIVDCINNVIPSRMRPPAVAVFIDVFIAGVLVVVSAFSTISKRLSIIEEI